ncbi:hypothetical protein CEXT_329921 [Caerostris extrusa]|uniref:Uncharacterized protein n=1 Tax=Caerostris extrusa TaxID=172846 RepID=A0AAV4SFH4_CAEEX|nr:hypothetical protein CEXT_329921 [Caerostris extrusa]
MLQGGRKEIFLILIHCYMRVEHIDEYLCVKNKLCNYFYRYSKGVKNWNSTFIIAENMKIDNKYTIIWYLYGKNI